MHVLHAFNDNTIAHCGSSACATSAPSDVEVESAVTDFEEISV